MQNSHTLPARSSGLRVFRNLTLLWVGLSLLGLAGAVAVMIYAMGWGCSDGSALRGSASWGACVMGSSVFLFGAIGSLISAIIVLFFAQLFYLAGARVREAGPFVRPRLFSREALFGKVVEEVADTVDVDDLLD